MKIYFPIYFVIVLTLFIPTHLYAKPLSEGEMVMLPPVVVTATRLETPLTETAASTSVIEGITLEEKKIKTVLEALREVPGLDVVQNGGPGGATSVFLRGTNSDHVLVLIDGVQVNSPTLGQYNFANLTTDNIDRIEIIRGPQSTLYGSDAIGGIIHIFTKKGEGTPTAVLSLEGGSYDSYRESLQLRGAKNHIDYAVSAARYDTDGFSRAAGNPERDGYGNTTISSRIGFQPTSETRLDWAIRYSHATADLDESFPIGDNAAIQENKTVSSALAFSSPIFKAWDQKLQFSFQREESEGRDPVPGFNNFKIETQIEQVDWQHDITLGEYNHFVIGYEFERQEGKNIGTFNQTLTNRAAYALNQLHLSPLILNIGLRFDGNEQFGDKVTYKGEVAYHIETTKTKLRAADGTGFHGPTLNDLYFPGAGNPNLKPEESHSYEFGLDQTVLGDAIQLSATYFHTQIDELILFVFDPNTFLGMPENVQEAKLKGWEFGVAWIISKRLSLSGNYTYTNTINMNTGKELARRPKRKAGGTLTIKPSDTLRLYLDLRYVGKRFNDTANTVPLNDYTVVNLAGNFQITQHIKIFSRIENLFDREYEEVAGFGTAGFSAYGGLKVSF